MNESLRFALPSKGRMGAETLEFLKECGFKLRRNRRQYIAQLEGFPDIQIIFQRQKDIIRGVQSGSFSYGIVGLDLVKELTYNSHNQIITIHDNLGFGQCSLELAISESWPTDTIKSLQDEKRKFRIATKFPNLSRAFLEKTNMDFELVESAGTIEVTPALGYADMIIDLVSTGQTLSDNRLKRLKDGMILKSQAVFIGNREALRNPIILNYAKTFLEFFEGMLRAKQFVSVFVNIRGETKKSVAEKLFSEKELEGLTGPTISEVLSKDKEFWFAVHIIVERNKLTKAIAGLRRAGGSGVIVTPALYIFEEEPIQYKRLLKSLEGLDD